MRGTAPALALLLAVACAGCNGATSYAVTEGPGPTPAPTPAPTGTPCAAVFDDFIDECLAERGCPDGTIECETAYVVCALTALDGVGGACCGRTYHTAEDREECRDSLGERPIL